MSTSNPYTTPSQASSHSLQMSTKDVLFSFSGRIPRRTWWLWYLVSVVAAVVIVGIASALFVSAPEVATTTSAMEIPSATAAAQPSVNPLFYVIAGLVYIPMIWINLALQAKRWHDRGKSAWWILIALVPFIGGLWALIECGFLRGTVGPNQFGADPT